MGAYESGQSFLAGALAKLPDAIRAQVEAVFNSAEARDAITLIGDGVLARSDYSKSKDALDAQSRTLAEQKASLDALYQDNTDWYQRNKAALEEYSVIKPKYDALARGDGNGNGNGDGDHRPAGLDAEAARKLAIAEIDRVGPDFMNATAWISTKALQHFHMFQEPLDMTELTQNPKLGKPIQGQPGRVFSLQDAYNEKFGEKVAEKQKAANDAAIEKIVQERLQAERAKGAAMPFPLRSEPSVLDTLNDKPAANQYTVDAAVEHYNRLQAERSA